MRFTKIFLLVVFTFSFLLCSEAENKESRNEKQNESILEEKTTKDDEDYKVTFIELGSVKCVPCQKMQPIMDEIEKEYEGIVKVVFYDVWTKEGADKAKPFKIRLIPTQVFLNSKGEEIYRHEGFFPKEKLVKIIEKILEMDKS